MSAEFTPEVHAALAERSEGVCEVCGASRAWDAHHRRPRGAGSTKRPESASITNALACCRPCHNLIESHRSLALVMGWLVPQGAEPWRVPVMRRGERVLLGDDGSIAPYEQKAS